MAAQAQQSIVQFLDLSTSPNHCGYCKGSGSLSQGMLLESLTVQDYQDLLDRGWRRSGRYVYKPCMETTCCPLYTIRCRVKEYQPSKSQRKVVKKVNNCIRYGTKNKVDDEDPSNTTTDQNASSMKGELIEKCNEEMGPEARDPIADDIKASSAEGGQGMRVEGLKKAKILRREKHIEKLIKAGEETMIASSAPQNKAKVLSDLVPDKNFFALNQLILQSEPDSAHKFELRLVKADLSDPEFMSSFHKSYRVYRKYQTVVHKDNPSDCDIQTFAGFLCDSPLIYETQGNKMFGAFHQQYLIDGAIVAVGVVDILPHSLSSVYLYYDPGWWGKVPSLSPGTYSAIREVQLTQQLNLPYYYMGFYIHSCPKMKYKGRFLPADLLSPTTFSWHNIEQAIPLLDAAKYSTFERIQATGPAPTFPSSDLGKMRLLVNNELVSYQEWQKDGPPSDEIGLFHQLIGQDLAQRLVLRWRENMMV